MSSPSTGAASAHGVSWGVRIFAVLACLLGLASVARAETLPDSTPGQAAAAQAYAEQKKSAALAVTLEVLSPIAGVGGFYAHDSDRATFLAVMSGLAAGAGVGSAFWLIHLDGQHPTGVDRVFQDAEQGTAIAVLATAAIVYLVARISGLILAPEATAAFNENLRQGLGVTPEPVVPFHALAPGPMFSVRF
jgi:hypothetical protein